MSSCSEKNIQVELIALHAKLDNIEFHEADIASLPVADKTVDVVISNGAINLCSMGSTTRLLKIRDLAKM